MSTIRAEDDIFGLLNVFHTPDRPSQDKLFDQWRSLPPAHTQPGLISGNFHRSTDGRSVINLAQWSTREHYQRFMAEAASKKRLGQALGYSSLENIPCEVVDVSAPSPVLSVSDGRFVVIVLAAVESADQASAIDVMTADVDATEHPGYVAHSIHRGLEGTHVIKYAQWENEASFQAFHRAPKKPTPLVDIAEIDLYFSHLEYVRE